MARAHRKDGRGPARPRDIRNGFNTKLLSTSARPRVHGSGFVGSSVASKSARVAAEAGSKRDVPLVLYAPFESVAGLYLPVCKADGGSSICEQ